MVHIKCDPDNSGPYYEMEEILRSKTKNSKYKSCKLSWSCKNCGATFDNRKSMVAHRTEIHIAPYETHQQKYSYNKLDDVYTCKNCDFDTPDCEVIKEHILVHEEKFECPHCKENFYSAYKFCVHIKKHNPEELFQCPLCSYTTSRSSSMLIHINTIHLQKYQYYCQFCGKGFHDSLTFKEHENNHLGAQPIVCVVCQKEFRYTKNLMVHQTTYHRVTIAGVDLRNQCPICNKIFSRPNTLNRHIKIHDRDKPYPKIYLCDTCGKGFARKNKLTTHYRVHTGDKPFKCSYCEKCFTKKDYLVLHERIHSGEKPYCCSYCGKRFNQDASLRIHVRGHTGERPYVCERCSNGFVSRAALKVHLNNCIGK
ncbi:hypothetical protein Trydic_g201 [Trypoxylus dichotomus]